MTTARKAARDRARKAAYEEKQRIAKYPCDHDGCKAKSTVEHVCIACEHLKKKEPHVSHACSKHAAWALEKTKKHTLTKHPVNLLRAIAAGLAGEEVF